MASKKALAVVNGILEYTTTKAIPTESRGVWMQVLEPVGDDLAIAAAMSVARTEQKCFAVAPGAIYQAALDILREELPTPGEAWAAVSEAIGKAASREGMYDDQRFAAIHGLPEPARKAAEQTGIMAMVNSRNLVADRSRFLEFYRVMIDKAVREQLTPALATVEREALPEGSTFKSDLT